MSPIRPIVLLTLSLLVAIPAAAQDRSGRSRVEQASNRDAEDSDSDSDSEDSDRRGRKHGNRADRRGRDVCMDADRDGRCDYSESDTRYPDRSSRGRSRDDVCMDRDRDGRCDTTRGRSRNRRGIPAALEAIIFGR